MAEDTTVETNLDQVAASLLVKPETKPEVKPVPKAEVKSVGEPNGEAPEDEQLDETGSEEAEAAAASEDAPEGEEAVDEGDVDIDEIELDITVDGEEKKVKLKDLKANYSGNGAIEKRLQEASEVRNQAMELGKTLHSALQEESIRLAKLEEIVKKQAEPDINWEELKRTNLPKYLLERDKQREAGERQRAVNAEQARVQEQQAKLEAQAHAAYTAEQAKQLVAKLPDFGDQTKAPVVFAKLTKAASTYGYAPEEVGGVLDHRAMLVLNDAMKYQELMAKQTAVQKKTVTPTALLRPGASAATRQVSSAKKLQDALVRKARASGKVDDVAAMLITRKK